MSKKIKIRVKKPYIAYPGSCLQQNYAEPYKHGYLLWEIKSSSNFNVNFCDLPNPKPFVTIEWNDEISLVLESATKYPKGTRYRIKSDKHISQKDISIITNRLRRDFNATEVTFRQDHKSSTEIIDAGTARLVREDLRNPDILVQLLRDYYSNVKISDSEWNDVIDLVKQYASNIQADVVSRNTKWSLKNLKFDNVFNYGEDNVINFEKLNGLIGIFGPNRSGKSSIVGAIMYALFNTSDRGSVKNKDICNSRKQSCFSRAIINSGGHDYVIERKTIKQETKQGEINAPTTLNLYKVIGKNVVDLAGEQRTNTEKIIRNLLGTSDDFCLTSLSAQGDSNQYIKHGSTKRRQALSRFLDLDVCWQLFEQSKQDLNSSKTILRKLPDRDWSLLISEKKILVKQIEIMLSTLGADSQKLRVKLSSLKQKLTKFVDYVPVTNQQVNQQKLKVNELSILIATKQNVLNEKNINIEKMTEKLDKAEKIILGHDLKKIKEERLKYQQLNLKLQNLQTSLNHESNIFDRQKRSFKILDEVPCGDEFSNCKFIKDAYKNKIDSAKQKIKIESILFNLDKNKKTLEKFVIVDVDNMIDKLEKLQKMISSLKLKISENNIECINVKLELDNLSESFNINQVKLSQQINAYENKENEEIVHIKNEISRIEIEIKTIDDKKLTLASSRGRYESELEQFQIEKQDRLFELQKMKAFEIVYNGFSKKGIPNLIVSSQLPVINLEIAKILGGIANFTVEVDREGENERIEIYINYGDSRRPIELASGMEKFMASMALRVAMINVSTLPKPDMFIIDEGFGSLDETSVESCNKLLVSLKRYFKTIIVITHIDAIKDVADQILEITKTEIDAKVSFN